MEKFIRIEWEYLASYGSGEYNGHFDIPVSMLNEKFNADLLDEETLRDFALHMRCNLFIDLGEVEGKHSEVILDSDDTYVTIEDSYKLPDLDTMEYDSLLYSFFSTAIAAFEPKEPLEDYVLASELEKELKAYEQNFESTHKDQLNEARAQELLVAMKTLKAEYEKLTGSAPVL